MLRFAFFKEFKSSPTLLLWGERQDIPALSQLLLDFAIGPRSVQLVGPDFLASADDVVTIMPHDGHGVGLERLSPHQREFHWYLTADAARQFAVLLDVLAATNSPCHQYLETASCRDTFTVLVASGEYPPELSP